MPNAAVRICTHPGCNTLTARGKCEPHRILMRRQVDEQRGSASERGYDAAWQKLRAAFLKAHPLCMCDECRAGELRVTAADVVDHREPIETRPDLRLDWSNLRSMSKAHHDAHTARTRGWAKARATG